MSHPKFTFSPPVKAPDCWDWIRPEDVARHALAAFYWACNNVKAPKGEKFLDADCRPYADRETFADCMTHFFDLRIKAEACWRRFKIEPPCRLNFEPGLMANL